MTSLLQRVDVQRISLTQRILAGLGFGSWTASRDRPRLGRSLKHFTAVLLFGLGVAGGHAATVSANAQPGSCVWHADANGLHQVQSDSNAVAQSISLKNIAAIAMNGSDCAAWAVTGKQLYKYDRNAAQALQVSLSPLNAKLNGAQLLAVDPYDDSAWLAHGKALFHIGANGQLVGSSIVPGTIETIAVALDRSVWVLGNKQLWHYSAQGALLASQDLHGSVNAKPKLLAIDTLGGILWLAGEKQLTRIDLSQAGQPALRIDLPHQVTALALNPLRGELWLTTGNDLLLAYGRDGGALYTVHLQANSLRDVANLAFDPVAQSLWTASRQALGRFSATGDFVAGLSGRDGSVALAAPAFMPAPAVALVRPPQNALTNNAQPAIAYRYDALCNGQPCTFTQDYFSGYSLSATLNQNPIGPFVFDAATGQASYAPASRLPEGQNHLSAQARDGFGNLSAIANDQFTIDTIPPGFLSMTPAPGSVLTVPQATIQGAVDDINATVVLDGVGAATNTGISGSSLNFSFTVALAPGLNAFTLSAIDKAGNIVTAVLQLTFTPPPPPAPVAAKVSIGTLTNGTVTVSGAAGAVEAGLRVAVTNTRTQQTINVNADGAGSFSAAIAVQAGDAITVSTVNQWGTTSANIQLNVASSKPVPIDPDTGPGIVPPDPATLAPPVVPTVSSNIASGTAFLYSGPNAIQTGVIPGTIETRRVAVVRGKVMDREGNALPAVRIRVLGHPEFGQTHSRADGMFDIAVNGGGYLTIDYSKAGYLPVQRTVRAPWQNYVVAPEIAMIPLDGQAATIDLMAANPIQVARGSVVSDKDGIRQATLLFPQGTAATMVLPNGTTQSLTSLTVRATEYTVGPNGPKAMPGSLPPASGYTYAVELSVDEAISAGAKTVEFNQPVYQYLENFLGFPVGSIVPTGYYDRQKASWIPSDNGIVVKILDIANSIATVDADGDGQADDATQLAALNISDSERIQLAALYASGVSLWRVPIRHFTPWDHNWPYGPPEGAAPPEVPDPGHPSTKDKPDCKAGSIIECQNQSLGESVPVTGTGFSLNYKSSRMPGYDAFSAPIPLSGATLPAGMKSIVLEVTVAGRKFTYSFEASPNQSFNFVWDRRDAYGREVPGELQVASIRVGYVYNAAYFSPANFSRSFGSFGGDIISRDGARGEITLWKDSNVTLGNWQSSTIGLGGWTLNVQHAYDSLGKVMHFGDGSTRGAQSQNGIISTIAGNGTHGFSGDGGPAIAAIVRLPRAIVADSAGNVYFITYAGKSGGLNAIRKIAVDGTITTVAGGGTSFFGNGVPATSVSLQALKGLAIDANGNLYASDLNSRTILKVTTDGLIRQIAGDGGYLDPGDGGPAVAADFRSPYGMAVDAQGNLYVADNDGRVVRKITPDGMISTVAGQWRSAGFSGDGGLAANAHLSSPTELAIDASGDLYILDHQRIRKITSDGVINTIAGNGAWASPMPPDGGLATESALASPDGMTIDAYGNIYINDSSYHRIRKIDRNGIISTVAGNGSRGFSGDGGPAKAAQLYRPYGVAVDNAGNLYVTDTDNARIRKISAFFPGVSESDFMIASEDGTQLYHFNANGRHLRTLSSVTGAEKYRFAYDSNGYIIQVTDGDGNMTQIERDSSGKPTAVVSPDGQRTVLTLGASGYLATIANPAGEITRMTYGQDGLLTEFINPRNQASTMTYDAIGRLIIDRDPAGGFWSLARSGSTRDHEVSMTSALNRQTRYRVEELSTGDALRTNTQPDGSISVSLQKTDGAYETTAADGTVTTSVTGPDPRFGMQAPIMKSVVIKTPNGLTRTVSSTRQATLSNLADPLSLATQTDTVILNGKTFTTVYNASQRQFTSTTPQGRSTIVKTDAQGRPVMEQLTGIQPVNYAYDTRGRLTSVSQGSGTDARTMSYAYNAQGYVDTVTDALNRRTRYAYNAAGRVTEVMLPDSRVVGFSYDANGNVASVTPPSRPAHSFDYNVVDLATGYTPPALGNQPVATRYEYNLDKEPVKVIRPDGQIIDYGYETGGRLSTLTMPTGVVSYGYTVNSGQLASVVTAGGIGLAYSYDGALPTVTAFTGPVAGNVSTAYDNFFRVSQLGVNGSNIAFGYDNDGLLMSAGSLTLTRNVGNGLVIGSTLDQITTSQGYDGFGQLASLTARLGATVLYEEQYARDKVGRLTQKTVNVGDQTSVYSYAYDAGGRLTDVTRDGASAGHFEYDANGNRTLAYGIVASYDDQDRLTDFGGAQYSYTANGELKRIVVGSNVTEYDYDVFGNLMRAALPDGGTLDYLVDGRNRRIGKKVNGTLTQGFLYQDQLKPAAELDGNGAVVARFVYADKANVPEYLVKGGVTYRIVTDQLGSVRLVVNSATGAVAQRIDYDDWGNVLSDSNPGFQPFGFAGGLYDRDTGLVRFGARDYDPKTARWTAKDPIGFAGGDTSLFNYVTGDPINKIDPSGLDWVYSQSTGQISRVDSNGNSTNVGTGYSGHGDGVNNPAMQDVRNTGPIPQGTYDIGTQQNNITGSGTRLPDSIRLTPQPGTNTFGRDGFIIHGDNGRGNRSASQGCPILDRNIRNRIGSSGDPVLRVVP